MNINQIKTELEELKLELQSRVSRTHKHIYHKEEPVSSNFNEQIKETENDGLVMALESEGLEEIAKIEQALGRIEAGTYGQCQECGAEVDEARLLAIPYAESCINCAK